jgi:hypothetical protein
MTLEEAMTLEVAMTLEAIVLVTMTLVMMIKI